MNRVTDPYFRDKGSALAELTADDILTFYKKQMEQEQYCIPSPGSFVYNQNSKPYLQDHPEIFFNMSHCESGVVCVLSEIEIVVDIQNPTPYDPRLAKRVCNVADLQRLAATDDPARLFCEMWARKESYAKAKAKGMGITDVLKKTLPEYGFRSLDGPGYWLSL